MLKQQGTANSSTTATEDHPTFIRALRTIAEQGIAQPAKKCPWCGAQHCANAYDHAILHRRDESTWRRAAA